MPSPIDLPLLEVSGIVAGYGDGPVILDGAHITVEPGKVHCIIGPNGAGKSTLLKAICGMLKIRKGEVNELKPLMKRSTEHGMQTFDQALYNLYSQGEITYEDALLYADSANDLRLMIKLGSETDGDHLTSMSQGLALEVSEEDPGRRFR